MCRSNHARVSLLALEGTLRETRQREEKGGIGIGREQQEEGHIEIWGWAMFANWYVAAVAWGGSELYA